jgi:hypothetical protein
VIRNVVVHITNEQPLLADLFELPVNTDAGLLCTNLRAMDGKRPVFIDHSESTFYFPYLVIRFLEIPTQALERHRTEPARGSREAAPAAASSREANQEETTLPAVIEVGAGLEAEPDDEIDEDFLRRIREV